VDVIHAITLEDESRAGHPNQGAVEKQTDLARRERQIRQHLVRKIKSVARMVSLWDNHGEADGVGVDRKECEMSFVLPNDMCWGLAMNDSTKDTGLNGFRIHLS
jgi:hypothetical protein